MLNKETNLRNINGSVYDIELKEKINSIKLDIQPISLTYTYNNGYKIPLTHKIFCDKNDITIRDYFVVNNTFYKVIKIYEYDSFLETHCYKCNVIRGA